MTAEPFKWWEQAACRGTDHEAFFPDNDASPSMASIEVTRICADCPVKFECRLAGMGEMYGYWGNTSPKDRSARRFTVLKRLLSRELYANDDWARLRRRLGEIISDPQGGSMFDKMARAGFNAAEMRLFHEDTHMDKRANARIAEHEKGKTNGNWRREVVGRAGWAWREDS